MQTCPLNTLGKNLWIICEVGRYESGGGKVRVIRNTRQLLLGSLSASASDVVEKLIGSGSGGGRRRRNLLILFLCLGCERRIVKSSVKTGDSWPHADFTIRRLN